jgi:hypothetical protein
MLTAIYEGIKDIDWVAYEWSRGNSIYRISDVQTDIIVAVKVFIVCD